jgi:hypothetical protein
LTISVQDFAGPHRAALAGLATGTDLAYARQAQAAVTPAVFGRETPAIPVRFEAEARKPIQRLESRKPRCLTRLHATKESIECFLQAAQGHLSPKITNSRPDLYRPCTSR